MSQYIIRPAIEEPELYEKQPLLLHEEKRIHTMFETPMLKMSYNDYLIKKNNNIVSVPLPDNSKCEEYRVLFRDRERYEGQVRDFVAQTQTKGGGYYFYNWVSNDECLCQVPAGGVPLLATYIFSYNNEKAQALIQKWQRNIITQTLSTLLKGLVNIIKIVKSDSQLHRTFFNKKINIKQVVNSQAKEFSHNKLLLLENSDSFQGVFDGMTSLDDKKNCILANLSYLKQFLLYFPNNQIDDYYKLIFAFLSNTQDQLESKKMYNLLLSSTNLSLTDRLNFVQKLVPLQGRHQFVAEFSLKVLSLTHLSNLLFFEARDEESMEKIVGNYLDQYGDLEAVAAVCLEYGTPRLMGFVDMYQEILVLSCEEKKAQDLQYQQYKKLGSFCLKRPPKPEPICHLFLNAINFAQQKIQLPETKQQDFTKVCYVCYRKNEFTQDLFVECGRCKHGGHLQHLLKWYEESRNVCPKTDCPCYCV